MWIAIAVNASVLIFIFVVSQWVAIKGPRDGITRLNIVVSGRLMIWMTLSLTVLLLSTVEASPLSLALEWLRSWG